MHLVSLAAVTWDFKLVGRTRMLTEAWQRAGQRTTFVQVPSYRTALQRVTAPLRQTDIAPVLRPWPTYPSRWWGEMSEARLRRSIRRRAAELRRHLDRLVKWDEAVALIISPVWTPWLEELAFRHAVYDCIDDLAVHVPRAGLAPLFSTWEEELIQRAAGAVTVTERLRAKIQQRRAELPTAVIRNGVDADGFRAAAAGAGRPPDVPHRGRPIVGFIGALYDWIDWALIEQTVRALPGCDFVFVGPHDRRAKARSLAVLPNAHLLGARPYGQVPAYVQAFDVCWVPFKGGDVAAGANPVKIYEYLSLGKPVVSTPVADMESFGRLVEVARTSTEMVEHLRREAGRPVTDAAERVAFAQANSWAARATAYVEFAEGLVAPESRSEKTG